MSEITRRQALGQTDRELTERGRHNLATEEVLRTGKIPFGWEVDAYGTPFYTMHFLAGLQSIPGVRVWGPSGLDGRTPTAAFTIRGVAPSGACSRSRTMPPCSAP